jgi:hypothetical protein
VNEDIMGSIDDILNSEPGAEPIVEAVAEPIIEPEPAIEAEPAAPRDDKGRFVPKGEDSGASPAPAAQEPFDPAPVIAERRRRQEAEQRAQGLEEELQALRNPPAPPPSIWDDEQGWQQQFGEKVTETAVERASLNATLNMSEMLVRQTNPDFEEMKEQFLRLAEENPVLRQQALSDPHPWNKAYQIAKNHKVMADLGATDVDSLRAKIREELVAEMAGQQPVREPATLPPTISTERNVGTRAGPAWAGPTPLTALLS